MTQTISTNKAEVREAISSQVERIFRENGTMIRNLIIRLTSDTGRVDDIFQEFFIALLRHPNPQEIINCKTYLYRVLSRDVIDFGRSVRSYRRNMSRLAKDLPRPAREGNPAKAVSLTDEYALVLKTADECLPRSLARALKLRYQQECSYSEIAEKMQINKDTARRYLCISRGRLRKELARRGLSDQ